MVYGRWYNCADIRLSYMSYPLTQQANSWIGYVICYIAIMGIYYSNVWNVSLPHSCVSLWRPRADLTGSMLVQDLPDAVYLAVFPERYQVQPAGRFWNHLHAQRHRARGDRPSCAHWF